MAKLILCDVDQCWRHRGETQKTVAKVTDVMGQERKHQTLIYLHALLAHIDRQEASESAAHIVYAHIGGWGVSPTGKSQWLLRA